MKKLRLDVEALKVESFTAAPAAEERGTVRGHEPTNGHGRFTCDVGCTQDIQCTNTAQAVSCFDPCV